MCDGAVIEGRVARKSMKPDQLLLPERLDQLVELGRGTAARVFAHGPYAVKVAHPTARARARLAEEIANLRALQSLVLPVPRLFAHDGDRALVRSLVRGPALAELLERDRETLDDGLLEQLWNIFVEVERLRVEQELVLDFSPANLFLDRRGKLWLVDLGRRLDPPLYLDLDRAGLREALLGYPAWRRVQQQRPDRLQPFLLPPSGRFQVEVPVGRAPGARLLWVNRELLGRLGTGWSRARIELLGSQASFAEPAHGELIASRYQDSPGTGEGQAQGDGRVLFLGSVDGGPYGRRELSLKGCGPTPLAWHGHDHHFDGLVSFPRTLWETSVCAELKRLGFETPEVLAIVANGAHTVDNTEQRWPAATAIRVASTHLRLGHLQRWQDQPDALRAITRQAGQLVIDRDFDPGKPSQLARLVLNFADSLGRDTGRSDALNIHGFNPTLGNLRIDGHFIDFSTIRFQRHYVPDYSYLDGKRRVRDHRRVLRRYAATFARLLQTGELLDEAQARRLKNRALGRFDTRYDAGYLRGLGAFLGFERLGVKPALRRLLVTETLRFRGLRADALLDFAFWNQRHPAPLFDLEGRAPEFVQAWRRGEPQPWRALRSEYPGELTPFARATAQSWFELLERALPPGELRRLRPRRFAEIVHPWMENNALAELCYRRSSVDDSRVWQRHMSDHQQLAEGRYSYPDARTEAHRRGHVQLAGLRPRTSEQVVGLTPELHAALCDLLDEIFGAALLGALAHGSRVMTRARRRQLLGAVPGLLPGGRWLREGRPVPSRGADLDLTVFVKPGVEVELLQARLIEGLTALQAPFPLPSRWQAGMVQVSAAGRLDAAVREYLAVTEVPRFQAEGAVILNDPLDELPADPGGAVSLS